MVSRNTRHASGNEPGKALAKNAQELKDRRNRALALRIEGCTYNQVAKALGVSYHTAYTDVTDQLRERAEEQIPIARQIESDRLDRVIEEAFKTMTARSGTEIALKAADRIMNAVRIKAVLFGLNAPVEVQITERTELDAEIATLAQQLQVRNDQTRREIIDGAVVEPIAQIEGAASDGQ